MAKTIKMSDYAIAKLKRETAEDPNAYLGTVPYKAMTQRAKKPKASPKKETMASLRARLKKAEAALANRQEPDWRTIAKKVLAQQKSQLERGMSEIERLEECLKDPLGDTIHNKPLRIPQC